MFTRTNSSNDFWSNIPIISCAVIIILILNYILYYLDIDRNADNSFTNLVTPNLNKIRNGNYWGLFTSSLLETNIVFLVWGIGWMWYFGMKIENFINIYSYILLILSSLIVSELFQILIFQTTGEGLGGVVTSLCGLLWFKSVFNESEWYFPSFEKIHLIAFIFVCILLNYTGLYSLGIAGLIGGLIWGLFLGFITTFRNPIIRVLMPTFIFGILLTPVFWAPWQTSWLINEAENYEKQNETEKAKEIYRQVLTKESNNKDAKENLIYILNNEAKDSFEQKDYRSSESIVFDILKIDPNNEEALSDLNLIRVTEMTSAAYDFFIQNEVKKGIEICYKVLEIEPENEFCKENLKIFKNLKK